MDCVLAIMAKAPRPGYVKTRLLRHYPSDQVLAIYRCLVEDTVSVARQLPDAHLAVVCPAGDRGELQAWLPDVEILEQAGAGLADGLASTFTIFGQQGFARIIALNCDTPHVPAAALVEAFELLRAREIVIGPTLDGGYYLVGATTAHPTLFDGSPLGTGNARAALEGRIRDLGLSLGLTEACYDVDRREDLERLREELRAHPERAPRTATWLAQGGPA